jgi:ferredoxin
MKKRYILTFPPKIVEVPLIYHLIKNYDVKINILKADVAPDEEGHLLIEMEGDNKNINKSIDYINKLEVIIKPIENTIRFEQSKCIHCGACTAVCFAEALAINPNSWELIFEPEKCVVCKLCIKACPLKLFDFNFE